MRWILVGVFSIAACKGESQPAAQELARPPAPTDAAPPDSIARDLAEGIASVPKELIEKGPWPGFVWQEIEVVSGDAFSNDVGAKLDYAYWEGVKACYDARLKKQPDLSGRVILTFSVAKHERDKSGRVTKADAEGFDAEIDACIETKAKRWSFHLMEGGPATFEVAIELNRKVPPPPIRN